METSNLPDEKLKTLVIRMLNELGSRKHKFSKNLHKEIENMKIIENIKELNQN